MLSLASGEEVPALTPDSRWRLRGLHELVSTYYVDNQLYTEEQNGQLSKYSYDPAGRTMETVNENTGSKTKTTVITHYAGSGNALTWTSEGSEKWTRNIPGIDGTLDVIQEAGKTPMLQLHDLQGNIVGTVEDTEAATALHETYNSTEFGVPTEGKAPPKYAWLGAVGVASEPAFASGVSTQGGSSYVPEIGRALQNGPIASPGAFPNGTGSVGIIIAPYTAAASADFHEIAAKEGAAREEANKIEAANRAFERKIPRKLSMPRRRTRRRQPSLGRWGNV